MRKSNRFRPTLNDKLEDRTVPSALLAKFVPFQALQSGGGSGTGSTSTGIGSGGGLGHTGALGLGGLGLGGLGLGGGPGCGGGLGLGGGSSSTLSQDARLVQQAFQAFDASYLSAVAALRLTASSTGGPSQAGLTAFNNAIAPAITMLNSAISQDLSNLTNTGSSLNTTINGYTATLQSELERAATGLANSSNAAVLALNQEANLYLRSAVQQVTSTILNDSATGSITSTTLQTYNQAVQTAYQAFNTAISNAEQTSISGGTALDSNAVSSAVSLLQTALTSAISNLPAAYTSSTYNPTSTVTADLTNLPSQLTTIKPPIAGNTTSARLFVRSVSSVVSQNEALINQAILTAIQNYNNSLL